MTITELVKESHETALAKGWWEPPVRSALEIHALIHSEIGEATEERRRHTESFYYPYKGENVSPEGEAVELADAIIRICDYFGYKGWDLESVLRAKLDYNKGRSYRHGGKKY